MEVTTRPSTQNRVRAAALRSTLIALLACGLPSGANAQDPDSPDSPDPDVGQIEIPGTPALPPEVLAALRSQAGAAKASGGKPDDRSPAEPATPEEKRVREFLKLGFDRSATNVLREIAAPVSALNEPQRFRRAVLAGDWPSVQSTLAALPPADARRVYAHLLSSFVRSVRVTPAAADPDPMQAQIQLQMQMAGGQQMPFPGTSRRVEAPTILLPEEVLHLADAAPEPLSVGQASQLGRILRGSLRGPGAMEPVIRRLEQGSARLGGTDPDKRKAAALLLIGAEAWTEAAPFLPQLAATPAASDPAALELHVRQLIAQAESPSSTQATALRLQAWELTQGILSSAQATPAQREAALQRAMQLLPELPPDAATRWMKEQFASGSERALAVVSLATATPGEAGRPPEPDQRRRQLGLQGELAALLRASDGLAIPLRNAALRSLALGWLQEADLSQARYRKPRIRSAQAEGNGNPGQVDFDPEEDGQPRDPSAAQALPFEAVLALRPNDAWIAALEESLQQRIRLATADLLIRNEQEAEAVDPIQQVAVRAPEAARQLVNDLLKAWQRSHNPNGDPNSPNQRRYAYNPMGQPLPIGIPLTRSMQVRNLKQLASLLAALRQLPAGILDERALAGAFISAHGAAEVFREEDIEQVFGPIAEIPAATLAELMQSMRQRLAGQWRAPAVQQAAQTKRSDKETVAEAGRGYGVVSRLVEAGLRQKPDDWRLHLAQAACWFDWAEFDYGNKVDLAVYTAKRDQAFQGFERAAAQYASAVSRMPIPQQTTLVYQQWLSATLGASDLAYLTRPSEPSAGQLARIATAIRALPEEATGRHLQLFAKSLSESLGTLKPELKPRYLRAALQVLGDHPGGAELRKSVAYYDDLLTELELNVRLDGDTVVGHGQPFGVFVGIRHSEAVGRESGGFGKYLQNQQSSPYGYNPTGLPPVNYRDDFEKQVREKLGAAFEVLSITFHDSRVAPRGFGRPGWVETPHSYLLLKAKDAAADRIPPLQLDMDFLDPLGPVVLPLVSAPLLLDARPATGTSRPASKIALSQLLDDRQWATGLLRVEIRASAQGLVPNLDALLNLDLAPLILDPVPDQSVSINRLDAQGDSIAALSERIWTATYRLPKDAPASRNFRFPPARKPDTSVTYKRYIDADLVEVAPQVALAGVPLGRPSVAQWLWPAAGGVLLAWILTLILRRRPKPEAAVAGGYRIPDPLTAFTLVALLDRMSRDSTLTLDPAHREELKTTIAALQQRYFSADVPQAQSTPDLREMADRWVSLSAGKPG